MTNDSRFWQYKVCARGVLTALKPTGAERVTNKLRDPTNPRLTPRKTGPVRSKKPAQAEQKRLESRHRRPRASPPYISLLIFVFWLYLSNLVFFSFFWHSGPVRQLVPSYRSPRRWFVRIFAGVPWRVASNDSGVIENVDFQDFRTLRLRHLRK